MTKAAAVKMLRSADEDETWDDVTEIFAALYDRAPDSSEDALSLCYAALPAEGPCR